MAISAPNPTSGLRSLPGPAIHSQSTTLCIAPTFHLRTSRFLPSLIKVINIAYHTSHASRPFLGLNNQGDRLTSTPEFFASFPDPSSFTLIIHPKDSSTEVLATASARRYHGPKPADGKPTRNTPWERKIPVQEGCEEWELKLMCTAPESQGQGLAAYMMRMVEEEIRRLHAERVAMGEAEMGKRLRIVLCTPRELTGGFYVRRGFATDYETWRGEGYQFHIVHMSKDIAAA